MAAQSDPATPGYNIAQDPALIKNRVYFGNLPRCTRKELESICHSYGTVLGSLVQKNFGFVQFEDEETANKCAEALNKSTFKSKTLIVRNASQKPKAPVANQAIGNNLNTVGDIGAGQVPMAVQGGIMMSAAAAATAVPINDCEIIVVNRENTKYAEFIEERLTLAGMRVDVLFPNEDVMLGQVLSNISARGCLYAVRVTPQNELHKSLTVNILYGVPAEHRNMPLEDAIQLIASDFRMKKQRDAAASSNAPRHPESMQKLIEMLANCRPLTGLQYECIIKYLQEQHELQLRRELGDAKARLVKHQETDPEMELQKKILSILNKPAVTEINNDLMYNSFEDAKADVRLMELLSDNRVLKALESIYNPELVETISQYL
ncbi:nuclear receptor coactivator 5 [Drosophila albomicans]|uniref:Nuclear receptor coactivator 5 n=1 Tax=Drosophila albomicans TaxID=7291 RepID=A0A6P8XGR8_DROAB|nr:nuclear receptor coactivator 5 [Drosophila albomicans]